MTSPATSATPSHDKSPFRRLPDIGAAILLVFGVGALAVTGVVALALGEASATSGGGPACTIYWTGHTSSDWTTATNWSLADGGSAAGRLPAATDDVCMSTAPSTATVVAPSVDQAVAGISFARNGSVVPHLEVQDAIFSVGSTTSSFASTINDLVLDPGASLAGAAAVNLTGSVDAQGGSNAVYGTGVKSIDAGATVYADGMSVGTDSATGQFVNNGQLYLVGGTLTLGTGTSTSGPASMTNNGFIYVTGGATFAVSGSGTEAPQLVNGSMGTIQTGDASGTAIYVPFTNDGTVRASSGPINVASDSSATGPDSGTYDTDGFAVSFSGGTRLLGAGASVTGGNGIAVTGGTAGFAVGVPVSDLTLAGGTVTGSPTVANATLTNGTLTGSGTMTLTGTSTLDYPTIDGGYKVLNDGQASAGDTAGDYITLTNAAVLENAGTFTQSTIYGINNGDTTANQVLNDTTGTWVVDVPSSQGTSTNIYAPFDNHGTVSVLVGALRPTQNTPGGADTGTYAISLGAQLDLGGGTRNFDGATQTGGGSFHLDGGTVTGTVTVANANLDWGTLTGSGTLTIAATGTAMLDYPTIDAGYKVLNDGQASAADTAGDYITLTNAAVLENAGTFTQSTIYGINNGDTTANQVLNDAAGTWVVNVPASQGTTTNIYAPFDNHGTVRVTTGTLVLAGGNTLSGTDSGTYTEATGTAVDVSDGSRQLSATSSSTGTGVFSVTGGTAGFAVGVPVSDLTLAGGTVTGSPTVANATLTNGTLTGSGTMTLTGTSTLDYPTIDGGYKVLNDGQASAGDTAGDYITLTNAAVLENAGTFTQSTIYGINNGDTTANQVLNDTTGTWVVDVPSSQGTSTNIYAPFDNHGTVSVLVGALRPTQNTPGGADTGTYAISLGAQLDLGGGTRNFDGATQTGGGSFHLDGGTVTGTMTVANANLDWGTLTGSGTLTIAATGTAMLDYPTIDAGYKVLNDGQASAADTAGDYITLTNAAVLENAGTFTQSTIYGINNGDTTANQVLNDAAGTWVVNVPASQGTTTNIYSRFTDDGTLQLTMGVLSALSLTNLSHGTLTGGTYLANTGTLEVGADITTNAASITTGTSGGITNNGSNALHSLAVNSGTLTLGNSLTTSAALANFGAITVGAGILQAPKVTQSAGSVSVATGATLNANPVTINGGFLTGTGTVIGSVTGAGKVIPGSPTGTLSVTGGYIPAPSFADTLAVTVASGGASQLALSGSAALNGGLDVNIAAGFTPAPGSTTQILSAGSVTGTFQSEAQSGPGNLYYTVAYTTTAVTLTWHQVPNVSISDVNVTQQPSTTTATFTVTLDTPSYRSLQLGYATQDGSALAGSDYQAASGTVTFPGDGSTTVESIAVTVNADPLCDPNEVFTVTLSGASPGVDAIGKPTGTGTIVNTTACATVPAAPTNVTATPGNASAIVSWSVPAANGSPISSYVVTAADQTTPANGAERTTGSASPLTVAGLTNGDSYTFTVTATNGVGSGSASAPSNAVTPASAAPVPAVASVSPASGSTAGGQTVTVGGTGFSAATTVVFGTAAGTNLVVSSDTVITVTAPAHVAGATAVRVTSAGGTSPSNSSDLYTYVAPVTVTSISPSSGPLAGGTVVTVTGTGFTSASTAAFGASAATKVTYVSATMVKATAPAGTGTVDVTVTVPSARSSAAVPADQFRYAPVPAMTSLSPNGGPVGGGQTVTMTGSGFTGTTRVAFGAIVATNVVVVSDTAVTVTTPARAAGVVAVRVATPGGVSPAVPGGDYTYGTPSVTSISPDAGPVAGGTVVTLTGTAFTAASTVRFGGPVATKVTYVSAVQLKATAPAGTGTVDVTVTTPAGTSPTGTADQFLYAPVPAMTSLSPNGGPVGGGQTVTMTGSGFTGTTRVAFGAIVATNVVVVSDTAVTVTTPARAAGVVAVRVTTPGGVSPVVPGGDYTYGTPASTPVAWGYNLGGELGNGTTTNSVTPVPVAVPAGVTLTAIAGGSAHTLALTSTGSVLAWGDNGYGELGNGTTTSSITPVAVSLPAGTKVTAVAAGGGDSFALTSAGSVLAWGDNSYGQLGNGTTANSTTPVAVSLPAGTTVTALAAGAEHGLALTSTGSVLAWGYNGDGELGNGTTITNSATPVAVSLPAGSTVKAVAAGDFHSLAITSTGSVLAWGYNQFGQLGDHATMNSTIPAPVSLPAGTTVTAIAGGDLHSLALTSAGSVLAWGANSYGQLGNATTAESTTPVPVSLPAGTIVTAVAAGEFHSLATTSAGSILAWGNNFDGQLGNGTTTGSTTPVSVSLPARTAVTVIAAGAVDSLALTYGTPAVTSIGPSAGPAAGATVVTLTGTRFTAASTVSFGGSAATKVTYVSAVQLKATAPAGTGTVDVTVTTLAGTSPTGPADRYRYAPVPALTSLSPYGGPTGGGQTVSIAGSGFTGATKVAFGAGAATNLVIVSDTAVTVTSPAHATGVVAVRVTTPGGVSPTVPAGNYTYNNNTTTAGALAWGNNPFGELGDGATTNSIGPVAVSLPAGITVTAVASGASHTLALTSTGSVLAWGYNGYGELGNGSTTNSLTPVAVALPAGTTVTAVAAGAYHSLALTSTGSVLAWGYNSSGQLGNGATTNSLTPVAVALPAGTTVTGIAAGAYHSLALTSTGSVLAWGYNSNGQLGNGATSTSITPVAVAVPAGTAVTALAAGEFHSLALTSTGSVLAWGYNVIGQLGNGSTADSATPVPVSLPTGTTVTAIAGGYLHSLALTSTGSVLAWGDNPYGQLGNSTTTSSSTPVPVSLPAGATVTAIAGGDNHSLALTSTGSVLAWGSNFYGQLGNGTTTDSATPAPVSLPAGTVVAAIDAGAGDSLAITR